MMKWWGWGDANIRFPMQDKPSLWPWILSTLGVKDLKVISPIQFEKIALPERRINNAFRDAISKQISQEQIKTDDMERLLHAYGKSFPDLLRVRSGIVKNPPDMVIYPRSHSEVVTIIRLANQLNVSVIPFGGGTNIVGCVEVTDSQNRMVVSLDLGQMNRLLAIDKYSMTATIEAGALGPKLEADLEKEGYSLGHHPDSFEYSTLGGWIATRSAGMQSDSYGRIEDMVVSLRVVTPSGEMQTKTVPATSAGPSVKHLLMGSEGILGVITEATMQIHPIPQEKDYRGFLFKSFDDGVKAIHQCYQENIVPSMFRLQDSGESQLAMHLKAPKKGLEGLVNTVMKKYLKNKGYSSPCIAVIGFEGEASEVAFKQKKIFKILKSWNAFPLGKSVGKTWSKDKYNVPYLRDYMMDYGVFADVAETSALWQHLLPVYHSSIASIRDKFAKDPHHAQGWIGCHLSHSYTTGACLYFTYAGIMDPKDPMKQYYQYKRTITDNFMAKNATLSHHHAIGIEHLPWMEKEVSPVALKAFSGMKNAVDPQGIMNPGKIIPQRLKQQLSQDEDSAEIDYPEHAKSPTLNA